MLLFHQLDQSDQHNAIHYCMHVVIEDLLEDGVQLEPFSEEDKKAKVALEQAVKDAKNLPDEEQFDFLASHNEVGDIIFDIALDMARSAFYHTDDELSIHFESLRASKEETLESSEKSKEELLSSPKKEKKVLN